MDRKMAEVARRKQHDDSLWLVAGMRIKAKNVYDALFVNDPYGRYRQCAVHAVLEDARWSSCGGGDLDDDFEFFCALAGKLQDPSDVDRLLEEIEPLVGTVSLEKTGCQCCGDVLDVDALVFTRCCDCLVCSRCMVTDDGERCAACGHWFSPVEILALLADE